MDTFSVGQKVWFRGAYEIEYSRWFYGVLVNIYAKQGEGGAQYVCEYACARHGSYCHIPESFVSAAVPAIISEDECAAMLKSEANEAYNRYSEARGHRDVAGDELPEWDCLTEETRQAWVAVIRLYVCMEQVE